MARTLTTHAATAKAIRATLKQAYPSVTFKVRSDAFSNGDSVDIDWTDGPTTAEVESLTKQHQYGHFDGMIDLYEYSNRRKDIPQTKYVQCQRDMSDAARHAIVDGLNRTRHGFDLRIVTKEYRGRTWEEIDEASNHYTGYGWASEEVWRVFSATSMVCRACGAHTLPYDAFCPQCGTKLAHEEAA